MARGRLSTDKRRNKVHITGIDAFGPAEARILLKAALVAAEEGRLSDGTMPTRREMSALRNAIEKLDACIRVARGD